jgi:hypothetical protein
MENIHFRYTNPPLTYIYIGSLFQGESGHLLFATQHSEELNDKGHLTSLVKWKSMIPRSVSYNFVEDLETELAIGAVEESKLLPESLLRRQSQH